MKEPIIKPTYTCSEIINFYAGYDKNFLMDHEESRKRLLAIIIDSWLGHNPSVQPRDNKEKNLFREAWDCAKVLKDNEEIILSSHHLVSEYHMVNDLVDLVTKDKRGRYIISFVLGDVHATDDWFTHPLVGIPKVLCSFQGLRLSLWKYLIYVNDILNDKTIDFNDIVIRFIVFGERKCEPRGYEIYINFDPKSVFCLTEFRRNETFIEEIRRKLNIPLEIPREKVFGKANDIVRQQEFSF